MHGSAILGHRAWEVAKMDASVINFLQSKSLFGAPVCQTTHPPNIAAVYDSCKWVRD